MCACVCVHMCTCAQRCLRCCASPGAHMNTYLQMHTCPQVFVLLYEAGCLPITGNMYHTYASALWDVANQATPVCTHAHGHAHAHARVHVCVCTTYPLHTCSTHTPYMLRCPVSILSPCRVCASTQSRPRGSDERPCHHPVHPQQRVPCNPISRPRARIGPCPRCSSPWSRGRSA